MTPATTTTTVTLVRHLAVSSEVVGRCYGQRLDPSLATDATPPAPQLTALAVGAVRRTSPAARARSTAAMIHDGAWTVDAAWAERDFGAWEGRSWKECWDDVPPAVLDSADGYLRFDPPGAESYATVAQRVVNSLAALVPGHHLIVTHAGPIRAVLHSGCGWSADRVFSSTIGHGGVVRLDLIGDQDQAHDQARWSARVGAPIAPNPNPAQ